jgi:septum site-determining protein MinD
MGKVIVITSGKGGVGKTTTAVNLGAALNAMGEDVLVVDANLSTPNVGIHLGAPIVPISLTHVLMGKAKVDEAIYEHESGTKILPCSLSIKEMEKIDQDKLHDIAKKLRKISDYIILDSAAGLGDEALAAIRVADEVIIVTNPELPAVTDALKAVSKARELGKEIRGVIITRVQKDGLDMPYLNVKEMLEIPVLGVIPEDKSVRKALVRKDAVFHTHPRSHAARAYREIASKISGRHQKKLSMYEKVLRKLGL